MMNKKFLWIAALLLAGCSDATDEIPAPDADLSGEAGDRVCLVRVGAAVGPEEESRAVYDADLKLHWESGDQILGIQGFTGTVGLHQTHDGVPMKLISGENTNRGVFEGPLTPHSDKNQYCYFVSPTTDGCSLSLTQNLGINPDHPVTATIAIPSEQSGRWIPYMWGVTSDKVAFANLEKEPVAFNILNGALAVRVYKSDKKTPKPVKTIIIEAAGADDHLVGSWSATTHGALTAGDFTFTGGGNTIEGKDLDRIEPLNGLYEYRFAVAPGTVEHLKLTLIDPDGTEVIRQADAKTFKANTRSGLNVYWDAATIKMTQAASWFTDRTPDGGRLYIGGKIAGAETSEITEIGVEIGGTDYPVDRSALNSDLTFSAAIDLPSGEYAPSLYAIVNGERIFCAHESTVMVTQKPTLDASIQSSYTNNGTTDPVNAIGGTAIDGSSIYTSWSLSDPIFAEKGLIASAELKYDNGSHDILSNATVSGLAWTTYPNCRIVVTLTNGYTLTSTPCSTILTGIPYVHDFANKNGTGWIFHNTDWASIVSNELQLKSADSADGAGYAVSPKFNIPSDIVVSCKSIGYQYCGNAAHRATWDIWIAPTSDTGFRPSVSNAPIKCTEKSVISTNGGHTMEGTFTLTSASSYVCIAHNGVNYKGAFGITTARDAIIHNISIKYPEN